MLATGLLGGICISILRFQGMLNPGRPLTTLVVILMLGGLQILSFGFIALQIGTLGREIFKVQRESGLLHLSIDVPGALFECAPTHRLFGGDVVNWQPTLAEAGRLWLTVMPGYNGPEQEAVRRAIDGAYPGLAVEDWGQVQLYLYDLRSGK